MIFLGKQSFLHSHKNREQKQDLKLGYFKLKMYYEGNNLQSDDELQKSRKYLQYSSDKWLISRI